MELGKKLRQARLEAGLTQRQLCGETITRNMLSQIENGSARPSMTTLQVLAGRLGKPVSFFLEETAVLSPNLEVMATVRQYFDQGNFKEAALAMEEYLGPDEVYDRERNLIQVLTCLGLAEQALEEGRNKLALSLLNRCEISLDYCQEALNRRRLLIQGQIPGQQVSHLLPSLDEELLLRAREALEQGNLPRAQGLLGAVEDPTKPAFHLLQGQVCFAAGDHALAVQHLEPVRDLWPKTVLSLLEQCYRELRDYRKAYEYACLQREFPSK